MKKASYFVRLGLPRGTGIESREALSQILSELASRFSFQGLEDWSVDLPESTKVLGAEREFHDLTKKGPMSQEILVYFRLKCDAVDFGRLVNASFEDLEASPPELLAKRDWMKEWRKHYKTQKVSGGRKSVYIVPAWKAVPRGKLAIKVNPGQAFGTGTHPTTRLCLKIFLERMNELPKGARLLDFGAGTGVLSIAALAAMKDANNKISATAVESDPEALIQCGKNTRLNRQTVRLLRKLPSATGFDFIFANVLAPVLVEFQHALSKRLRAGGLLVVSGILASDGDNFLSQFSSKSLKLVDQKVEGDWVAYLFSKP